MGNSLRCCLACVLPCGALDVVRVVHLNGHVEEFSRSVTAGEIMRANPNHVLTKPCSQEVPHWILIVSPDSDLRRGSIYFLIPKSSSLQEKKGKKKKKAQKTQPCRKNPSTTTTTTTTVEVSNDGSNFNKVILEKKSGRDGRRSGRVAVWRPHLESISEDPSTAVRLPPEF